MTIFLPSQHTMVTGQKPPTKSPPDTTATRTKATRTKATRTKAPRQYSPQGLLKRLLRNMPLTLTCSKQGLPILKKIQPLVCFGFYTGGLLSGSFCLGGFCPGGFCLGGFFSRAFDHFMYKQFNPLLHFDVHLDTGLSP